MGSGSSEQVVLAVVDLNGLSLEFASSQLQEDREAPQAGRRPWELL